MKRKKWLSVFLAAAFAVFSLTWSGITASALDLSQFVADSPFTELEKETDDSETDADAGALNDAESAEETEKSEDSTVALDTVAADGETENTEAYEVLQSPDEPKTVEEDTNGDEDSDEDSDEDQDQDQDQDEDQDQDQEHSDDTSAGVQDAYLVVTDRTIEECKAMSRQELLDMLVDSDGEKLEVLDSTTVVRIHFVDENGNELQEEYYELQISETTNWLLFFISTKPMERPWGGSDTMHGSPLITIMSVTLDDKPDQDDVNKIPGDFQENTDTKVPENEKTNVHEENSTERENGSTEDASNIEVGENSGSEYGADTGKNSAEKEETDTEENDAKTSSPKTGDAATPEIWLSVMIVSGAVLLSVSIISKRRGMR